MTHPPRWEVKGSTVVWPRQTFVLFAAHGPAERLGGDDFSGIGEKCALWAGCLFAIRRSRILFHAACLNANLDPMPVDSIYRAAFVAANSYRQDVADRLGPECGL